jgi:hypothetical protein
MMMLALALIAAILIFFGATLLRSGILRLIGEADEIDQ